MDGSEVGWVEEGMGDEKVETVNASSFSESLALRGVNRNKVVATETSGGEWVFFFLKKANITAYTKMKRWMTGG